MTGLFITFEGTDGAGKSTLIRALEKRLASAGQRVLCTREPGGSQLAEKIRSILMTENMDRMTELFLFEASRAEHLAMTVRPALHDGKIVLCDRYADSSLAYQGMARGIPWKTVLEANRLAIQGFVPHLTVLLDIDPVFALERAQEKNRNEKEGADFQIKVRSGFLKAMRTDPKRWFRLKIKDQSAELLADTVYAEIQRRFPKRFKKSRGAR